MGLVRFLNNETFECGCTIVRYCEVVPSRESESGAVEDRAHAYTEEKGEGCEMAAGEHGRVPAAATAELKPVGVVAKAALAGFTVPANRRTPARGRT